MADQRAGDDPYEGCAVYAEHGACVCSTGIVGNCQADREPQPTDGPDFHAEHAAWRTRNGRVTGRAGYRRMRLGWILMSLPVGFRKPIGFLLRHGPYRWGARLHDSGMAAERRAFRG